MTGFPRGAAKPALEAIMRRYGIRPSSQQGEGYRITSQLDAPKVKNERAISRALHILTCYKPQQFSLATAPLNFEWRHYSSQPPATQSVHPTKEPALGPDDDRDLETHRAEPSPEHYEFHFLVRILECSVTLHCQVSAESAAEARAQVQRIPNLLNWREISAKEIAEITTIESAEDSSIYDADLLP
jgi:hypothetical protein